MKRSGSKQGLSIARPIRALSPLFGVSSLHLSESKNLKYANYPCNGGCSFTITRSRQVTTASRRLVFGRSFSFPNIQQYNLHRFLRILLVFSVTPFKIDPNKNQNLSIKIKSRIWEMKGGAYTKTLAKIQIRGIFRIRDIRRNVLPKLIEICMETPCWCSPG